LDNVEFTTKRIGPVVAETRIAGLTAGDKTGILYMSDIHWDAKTCNRTLLKKHLDKAKENNWGVVIAGDVFDAMQGKFDPRRNMDELRPELQVGNYFDELINLATEWFAPWASIIHLASYGNHETSIIRHNNTDLLERWVYSMRTVNKSPVVKGGYGTWHMLRFMSGKKVGTTKKAYYYHGKGGASPVTLGVIDTNRQAAFLNDVDLVVNGHNHQGYVVGLPKIGLTERGKIERGITYFLRTPGYKASGIDEPFGFDIEKLSPKPNGSILVEFGINGDGSYNDRLSMNAMTLFE